MEAKTNAKAGFLLGEPVRSSCRKLGGILLLVVLAALPSWAQKTTPPDDPLYVYQWGLKKIGAVDAWRRHTGSNSNVVAVIDQGIDSAHEDLKKNLWSASTAFTVTIPTGVSYPVAIGSHGVNVADPSNSNFTEDESPEGHGTAAAGIIGAEGNNKIGIAGLNWVASVMAIKIDPQVPNEAIGGIFVAVEMKRLYIASGGRNGADVRVISISLGLDQDPGRVLFNAIRAAQYQNILIVASAGNNGRDNDDPRNPPVYPANYNAQPNVISVAASDQSDSLARWQKSDCTPESSNFGATSVDLAAPGKDVVTTYRHDLPVTFATPPKCPHPPGNGQAKPGYARYASGTSFAAPFVSGAAALILSACPRLDATNLKKLILDNVDAIPSLSGKTVVPPGHPGTGGRLNLYKAIRACTGDTLQGMTTPTPGSTLSSSAKSAASSSPGVAGTGGTTPGTGSDAGKLGQATPGGSGSLNFLQNAFVLGVQTGFVEALTYGNLDASYLIQQVLPAMPSYATALGLPQDQLNAMIAQLQSGAASGDAYATVEGMYAQFDQRLNRNCVCGNVYNLAKAYEAGQQIGWAEMVAYMAAHQNVLPALAGVLTNARQAAAVVGLPTNGLDAVIARVQAGASGCDVAPDLQNIEKQFEQSTNQPCTCMVDVNSQPNPNGGGPMNPTPLGPGQSSPQPSPQGQGTCGRVIYQNNGTIFGGVDGHPLVVRPNGLQARVVHLEVPANTYLNLDAVMIFDSSGTNVALNKPAAESSESPWSQKEPPGVSPAQGAVDGHTPDGGYHIHTNIDQNNPSWWEVDLQQVYAITEIRVYNRMDEAARAAHVRICVR